MTLSQSVIAADRKFEKASASASEALMELRWHWTLDESNAKRVSIREYARAVGKASTTIKSDANGFALHLERGTPLTQAREQANMGAETWAATEAVAKARGIQAGTARQDRPVEVRRVREIARERAEQHGTTVEEETRKAADWIVRSETTAARTQADRQKRLGLRFVEMEGELTAAQKRLTNALNLAHSVPWGDEERELLANTISGVKALLNLIDLAMTGAADVDWDAELAGLERSR